MTNDFTLDDVLDSIMVAEEEPTYDALNRWIERFPQYRKDLSSFFAAWAVQSVHPDEAPTIDSDALASRGVSYARN